jgi:hypothetical protein
VGQNQYRGSESDATEATGSPHNLNGCKDRVSASFQQRAPFVVNPNATGDGAKNNPGIPVDHAMKASIDKR